jgi:AraC family ethanolamine operon transcriptional activator
MNHEWSIETVAIDGPEDLREITRGSDVEVTQIRPGKLHGSIRHFGSLGVSVGRFNSPIRSKGPLHREKVVLGTNLSAGRTSNWWEETRPGDVVIYPPGVAADAIHDDSGVYVAVPIALPELSLLFSSEGRLADPAFWTSKRLCRPNPGVCDEVRPRLIGIMRDAERKTLPPSAQSIDFLRRTIIEAFVVSVISGLPLTDSQRWTGARLVSEAEDYVDAKGVFAAGGRPVHISELCSALKVSRRTLHRAFSDTLGIAPLQYLRRRRLSAIRSVLTQCNPAGASIGDLAFEYGFPESGRFAAYYHDHFGETPSETLRSRSGTMHSIN